MKIIFDSKSFVVCVKPVGVVSESDGASGMPDLLAEQLGGSFYTVHRLDKNVSGVMVYAKTAEAAAALSAQIVSGDFEKRYRAVCYGCPGEGGMTDLLFKDSRRGKAFVVSRKRRGVREASLSFSTLKTFELSGREVSLVEIHLHTGRFHQIRVQFSSRGFPLVGDRRYGSKDSFRDPMLFACRLSFISPDDGKRVDFSEKEDFGIDSAII